MAGVSRNGPKRKGETMKYKYLKGTGIQLSQMTLGSSTFGDQLGAEESCRIMETALEAGVNSIDTGDVYCGGRSEEIIGRFLSRPGVRRQVVVGTKMGLATGDGVNEKRASRLHMIEALEASLKRLKTDYVDIYYIHHPDRDTPMEETLSAMNDLVHSGKVRYIGFSNYSAWEACDLLWTARHAHWVLPTAAQNVHNLITRGLEDEMAYFVQKHSMGLVVYNPLAGGLLTGKHSRRQLAPGTRYESKMYQERYCNDANFDAVEALSVIAAEAGMTLLELAVRFSVSFPYVDSVLMGFSRLEQLAENRRLLEKGPLDAETMAACDQVWKRLKGDTYGYFIPPAGAKGITYTGTLK